jgi:ClpP class serine protease
MSHDDVGQSSPPFRSFFEVFAMRKTRVVIVAAAVGLVLLWLLVRSDGPSIEEGSILVLPIEGHYVESQDPSLLARILTDTGMSFAALLSEMKKAERDDRLSTVVLRIRKLAIGWGQAQELRDAIRRLREAGRSPIAYFEVAGFGANLEYYVASAADEVQIAPAGFGGVIGARSMTFCTAAGVRSRLSAIPEMNWWLMESSREFAVSR